MNGLLLAPALRGRAPAALVRSPRKARLTSATTGASRPGKSGDSEAGAGPLLTDTGSLYPEENPWEPLEGFPRV